MDPHQLTRTKRARDDSPESNPESNSNHLDSVRVKRIKDDLLSLLDDSDVLPERDSVSHDPDLDSVIRSFEEEISGGFAGESLSDLGELLETQTEFPSGGSELGRVMTELDRVGEFWDFQDEFPSYDSFGFEQSNGNDQVGNSGNIDDEYVELGGLFDYPDFSFGSDPTWRPETLPAL